MSVKCSFFFTRKLKNFALLNLEFLSYVGTSIDIPWNYGPIKHVISLI